jgi:hypothetical protein
MQKEFPHAELSIVEVNGCPTQSKVTLIRIDKISESGFSFASVLRFPVNPQIILNLRFTILNETIDLQGTIKSSQFKADFNQFEVVFIRNGQEKSKLNMMLSNFTMQYAMLRLKAEYYYNTFSEAAYNLKKSQINIWM